VPRLRAKRRAALFLRIAAAAAWPAPPETKQKARKKTEKQRTATKSKDLQTPRDSERGAKS
jgi:hypothetical protein